VLQVCGLSQEARSTFVLVLSTGIPAVLVGFKDVRVLAYERWGPRVELVIELVKERAVVHLRRPAGLSHPDVVGLEGAPHALCEPVVPKRTCVLEDRASRPCSASSRRGPPSGRRSKSEAGAVLEVVWVQRSTLSRLVSQECNGHNGSNPPAQPLPFARHRKRV